MSRILHIPVVLLFSSVIIASCKKDSVKTTTSTMDVVIKKNELYKLDLGSPCDECGLSVSHQAKHYSKSEITIDTAGQRLNFYYQYKPTLDYTGTDEVEIKSSSGSNGSSPNNRIHLNSIKFTITN